MRPRGVNALQHAAGGAGALQQHAAGRVRVVGTPQHAAGEVSALLHDVAEVKASTH